MPTASVVPVNRRSGFTLLETVACIAIVGTSIVAAIAMFGMHEEVSGTERRAWEAFRFLTRAVEQTRSMEYSSLVTEDFAGVPEDPQYQVRREVEAIGADRKRVVNLIRWTSELGTVRTDSVETIRCEGVGR